MSKVAVVVKLAAAAGKGAQLVEAFSSLYQGALDAESGTLLHIVHQGKDDPDNVYFYELYESQEALAAHNNGDALKSVFPKLAGLVAGRPEVTTVVPANAKGIAI